MDAARRRPERDADGQLPRVARAERGLRVRDLRGRVALVRRRAGRVLAVGLGPLRRPIAHDAAGAGPGRRRGCPAPAGSRARRSTTPSTRCALPGRAPDDVVIVGAIADARARRADRGELRDAVGALPRGPARASASRRGDRVAALPAQHPRGGRRPPRHRVARRDLVVVRAGVRDPGRGRPVRPDRADGAARGRRLPLRRQGDRPVAAEVAEIRAALPSLRATVVVPYLRSESEAVGAVPGAIAWSALLAEPAPLAFEPRPVRPPALRAVLVGHDRAAQADRPRPRRHPARAPQGARAPHRPRARRPVLLVHHDRLDDVELPRLGPARRARPSCCSTATRRGPTCRRCGASPPTTGTTYLGVERPVPHGLPQGRPRAGRDLDLSRAARRRLDRRAAAGGGLPLGARGGVGRDPARLAERRHRRVHRVRRAVAAGAGLGGRDQLPDARRAGRGVRSRRAVA